MIIWGQGLQLHQVTCDLKNLDYSSLTRLAASHWSHSLGKTDTQELSLHLKLTRLKQTLWTWWPSSPAFSIARSQTAKTASCLLLVLTSTDCHAPNSTATTAAAQGWVIVLDYTATARKHSAPLLPQQQPTAEWSCWIPLQLPRNIQLNIYN